MSFIPLDDSDGLDIFDLNVVPSTPSTAVKKEPRRSPSPRRHRDKCRSRSHDRGSRSSVARSRDSNYVDRRERSRSRDRGYDRDKERRKRRSRSRSRSPRSRRSRSRERARSRSKSRSPRRDRHAESDEDDSKRRRTTTYGGGGGGGGFDFTTNSIFCGGLTADTTEDDLYHYFSKYGRVTSAKLHTDDQGKSRYFGFVRFEEPRVYDKVASMKHTIHGRQINVTRAMSKEELMSQKYEGVVARDQHRDDRGRDDGGRGDDRSNNRDRSDRRERSASPPRRGGGANDNRELYTMDIYSLLLEIRRIPIKVDAMKRHLRAIHELFVYNGNEDTPEKRLPFYQVVSNITKRESKIFVASKFVSNGIEINNPHEALPWFFVLSYLVHYDYFDLIGKELCTHEHFSLLLCHLLHLILGSSSFAIDVDYKVATIKLTHKISNMISSAVSRLQRADPKSSGISESTMTELRVVNDFVQLLAKNSEKPTGPDTPTAQSTRLFIFNVRKARTIYGPHFQKLFLSAFYMLNKQILRVSDFAYYKLPNQHPPGMFSNCTVKLAAGDNAYGTKAIHEDIEEHIDEAERFLKLASHAIFQDTALLSVPGTMRRILETHLKLTVPPKSSPSSSSSSFALLEGMSQAAEGAAAPSEEAQQQLQQQKQPCIVLENLVEDLSQRMLSTMFFSEYYDPRYQHRMSIKEALRLTFEHVAKKNNLVPEQEVRVMDRHDPIPRVVTCYYGVQMEADNVPEYCLCGQIQFHEHQPVSRIRCFFSKK